MDGPPPHKPVDVELTKRPLLFRMFRSIITLHGKPEQIAAGAAVGMVVAFTPTLGFQIALSVLIATLLGVSRAAAIIPVWITNPFTMIPIYSFTYEVGRVFTGGPSTGEAMSRLRSLAGRVASHEIWDVYDRVREVLGLGAEIFMPLMVGGLIIGSLCAAVTYPVILRLVRRYQAERQSRTASGEGRMSDG